MTPSRLQGFVELWKPHLRKELHDKLAADLRAVVEEAVGEKVALAEWGCPCRYVAPCSLSCSCFDSVQSGGCLRCCRYGNGEQRAAAARRLVAAEAARDGLRVALAEEREACANVAEAESCFENEPESECLKQIESQSRIENIRVAAHMTKDAIARAIRQRAPAPAPEREAP